MSDTNRDNVIDLMNENTRLRRERDEARAEVERLTRERDEALAERDEQQAAHRAYRAAWSRENSALRAEVEALKAALARETQRADDNARVIREALPPGHEAALTEAEGGES
jgi:hypothetical protein